MKKSNSILSKIWLIATVLIVLAGIVLLSVFGFNNTVDYSKGYELTVGVDQNVDNQNLIETTTESFFAENNIAPKKYSKVFLNDGSYVVYKFDGVIEFDKFYKDALISKLETALNNEYIAVSVDFKEFKSFSEVNALSIALALIISAVAIFVFTIIFGKGRIAVTNLFASIVSVLSYLGMIALFRVPVCNFLGVFTAFSLALSVLVATLLTFKFKNILRIVSNEKMPLSEVASQGVKEGLPKFIVIIASVLALCVALLVFGTAYLKILALHLLISAVASFGASLIGAPAVWALIK